jgi:hypothetical protein
MICYTAEFFAAEGVLFGATDVYLYSFILNFTFFLRTTQIAIQASE